MSELTIPEQYLMEEVTGCERKKIIAEIEVIAQNVISGRHNSWFNITDIFYAIYNFNMDWNELSFTRDDLKKTKAWEKLESRYELLEHRDKELREEEKTMNAMTEFLDSKFSATESTKEVFMDCLDKSPKQEKPMRFEELNNGFKCKKMFSAHKKHSVIYDGKYNEYYLDLLLGKNVLKNYCKENYRHGFTPSEAIVKRGVELVDELKQAHKNNEPSMFSIILEELRDLVIIYRQPSFAFFGLTYKELYEMLDSFDEVSGLDVPESDFTN